MSTRIASFSASSFHLIYLLMALGIEPKVFTHPKQVFDPLSDTLPKSQHQILGYLHRFYQENISNLKIQSLKHSGLRAGMHLGCQTRDAPSTLTWPFLV